MKTRTAAAKVARRRSGTERPTSAAEEPGWSTAIAQVFQRRRNDYPPVNSADRRALPSVGQVLQALGPVGLPRALTLATVRQEIAALRGQKEIPELGDILVHLRAACERLRRMRLQPVINGTGVLLHTNLGRAPLGPQVVARLGGIAANFNNLEYDLEEGTRGHRAAYLESNLALLCGAEAATVVNNCAAALVLVLRHFTAKTFEAESLSRAGRSRRERRRVAAPARRPDLTMQACPEVLISRGELIQIGGGFRVPEILEASGARLREVGTTNKTVLADYARAIGRQPALMLKVHRSNFVMEGFVESPGTAELAAVAHAHKVPFVEDLGSGAVVRTENVLGLEHEPTPAELLKQGADLVTFSGDKLFGGPQAGIIAGKAKLIGALKREPFFRALRCDKLVLAALETTVDLYLEGNPEDSLPLLAMLHTSVDRLRQRAERMVAELDGLSVDIRVGKGKAQVGGGSLPRSAIPSVTLDFEPQRLSPAAFATRMRRGFPPVIGYVSGGRFHLDLRTVFPAQDEALVRAIRSASA